MPELPEAETIARQLQTLIAGKRTVKIKIVDAKVADPAIAKIVPFQVKAVWRRGKAVILELSSQQYLLTRLGMTGKAPPASPLHGWFLTHPCLFSSQNTRIVYTTVTFIYRYYFPPQKWEKEVITIYSSGLRIRNSTTLTPSCEAPFFPSR